jgi:hypothetical protein
MGASYSTTLPGATESQKDRFGVFSLRTKQNQSLVVLEDLITELMKDEGIISLMSLKTEGKTGISCSDMFIVLSSSLKKEFQLFKFPDPVRPSEISDVAYLPRTVYDKQYRDDPKRNELCKNIAWFMVRFCTLIFALSSSLKVHKMDFNLSKPLFVPTVVEKKKLEFDLKKIDGYGNIQFKPTIMFINTPSVLIDIDTSVIFTAGDSISYGMVDIKESIPKESELLRQLKQQLQVLNQMINPDPLRKAEFEIRIQAEETKEKPKEYLVTIYPCDEKGCKIPTGSSRPTPPPGPIQPTPPPGPIQPTPPPGPIQPTPPPPGPVSPPGPGGPAAGSEISYGLSIAPPGSKYSGSGGKRKTHKKTRHLRRRKTYKYIGGADNGELGLSLGTVQFILYKNGLTSTINDPLTKIPFSDRVKQELDRFPYKVRSDENRFSTLGNINAQVINKMSTIANILKKQKDQSNDEGVSPAQYRAYILATETKELIESRKSLKISFCEDVWSNKQVTRILSYALLDALFKDQIGDKISTASGIEYEKIVNQFVIRKMMKPNESGSTTTFSDLNFTSAMESLPELCSRTEYSITNPLFIQMLMDAHKSIRDLYDTHMQLVIQFITSKIISPKFRGYRAEPQWTMNPIFSTDSRGALVVLESIIKEARSMLVKHYFAVESVYVSTLEKMKQMGSGLGEVPSNPLTTPNKKNETFTKLNSSNSSNSSTSSVISATLSTSTSSTS